METLQNEVIDFTRIKNDINGNPRFVCHFLNFLTDKDKEDIRQDFRASLALNPFQEINFQYQIALIKAKKLGGKKFHNKQYGGGIVFQMYAGQDEEMTQLINELNKQPL